jgi:hypothetical protein
VKAADASLTKINRARFLPAEVKTMLGDYREGGSMTFNDFENLRTILAAEGRKAARAGDGNAEAAISACSRVAGVPADVAGGRWNQAAG